jgi:negative regulator of flagellin synthesis FlgM
MKVNGIGTNKVINLYSQNRKVETKEVKEVKRDSLEISSAGRSLSSLSTAGNFENSAEKIEAIKKSISQGTYKPSSEQIAKKIMDTIKGREV